MLACLPCSRRMDGSLRTGDSDDDDGDDDHLSETAAAESSSSKCTIDRIIRMAARCNPPCSGRNYKDSERFSGFYRRAGNSNDVEERKLKSFLSGSCTPASVSCRTESAVFMEEDEEEEKEWIAQVEPGVLITFVSMPHGGNDLKKIRFSRDLFDKVQAQRWWAENYDKVMELYNVRKSNRHLNQAPQNNEVLEPQPSAPNDTLSSARSSASDQENEWVEQDEPGVYITIGVSSTGSRELRRVRFSRDRFEETQARLWWEENKTRIQRQYL